ncbi:MAG: S8 family serine peptidase, partial [Halobacteriota archaeon]
MATNREQLFAVAFSVVLLFSLFAAAGPAIAASANTDEPFDEDSLADVEVQTQSIDDVYVDDKASAAVEQVDGDTSELYVRFDPEISEVGESVEVNSPDDLRVEAETTQAPFAKFAQETEGIDVTESFWVDNAMLIEIDPEQITIADIAEIDGVTEIHPNYEVESPEPVEGPEDAHIPSTESTTYGLDQVNAPSVWEDFDVTGEGVTVAVVDTGVDPDHPEFESYDEDNWAAFGFSGEPLHEQDEEFSEPFDANAHGTHVSGTVLGGDASGESIGVAPNAELYAINVFPDPSTGTTLAAIVAGLQHAVDEDVDIANFSLGGPGFAAIYIDVVRNAMDAGTLVVSSSGNDGVDSTGTPGNVYDAIAAGATDESQQVASFSTGDRVNTTEDWGPLAPDDWPEEYKTPDVSAPGVLVTSSIPTDIAEQFDFDEPYAEFSGTSMAAPHTTGTAALIMSETDRTPNETKELIQASATKPHPLDISPEVQADAAALDDTDALEDDTVRDVRYGYGIIDAYAAFQSIDEENVSTIEGTVTFENELSFVYANGTTQTLGADEPIDGGPVSIDKEGIRDTRTDEEGVYSFDVINGSYEVSVEDPIFQGSTNVTVDGEDISGADLEVSPTTAADLANPQPDEIASGEPIELNLAVFETDTYTVSLNESATATAEDIESVTIEYNNSTETQTIDGDGSDLADGDVSVDFADTFNGEVVVTVETNSSAEAGTTIDLQHTFVGPDGEFLVDGETPVTGPTELRGAQATSDPLTITDIDAPADEVVYTDEESTVEVTVENTGDFTEETNVTLGAVNGSLDPEAVL